MEVVLTVHDELLIEIEKNKVDLQKLRTFMSKPPAWAPDLPLDASVWTGERYIKS